MRLWIPVLLSVGALGCVHRTAEERILAAFSTETADRIFAGEESPQYVAFRDDQSERVFGHLTRSGAYRLTENGPLFCPGIPESGNHGYVVGAHVATVMGDSALATVTLLCTRFIPKCADPQPCFAMGGGTVQYSTDYLLKRINGKWNVIKPVSGGVTIPM